MISFEEHIYFDDPLVGHPDVRTRLKDASYFFFGNGLIQGAVQYSPVGEGSPFGLLIMNPEVLDMKRNTLTMNKSEGLSGTALSISENNLTGRFDRTGTIAWRGDSDFPVIEVRWLWNDIKVTENIFCPDRSHPSFSREILLENLLTGTRKIILRTSVPGEMLCQEIDIPGRSITNICFSYSLVAGTSARVRLLTGGGVPRSVSYWDNKASVKTDLESIERFFNSSHYQLASMISESGKMDASVWQYNREWVRDHSFMCLGLIYTGHNDLARIFLERLLMKFVSDDGDTIDSSEKRNYDEVELDQNGELLFTINEYQKWTGDADFILQQKEKIVSLAEFPLKPCFSESGSGLLHNSREYWERHAIHGITDGFEFAYQMWVIKGLKAAALLGSEYGFGYPVKWDEKADELFKSLFDREKKGLICDGALIKRRDLNGKLARKINPKAENGLPEGVPLLSKKEHLLNPDTSVSQAIVYDIIDPQADLALNSMETIERLWNQEWEGGGYGRYNVSSEPDSPGPWPFPSLFVARAYHKMGKYDKVERVLNWLDSIPGGNSGSWFENYGDRISPPFPQVGITPWTWSEVIMLVVKDILGVEPEGNFVRIRPDILPSINRFEARIQVKGMIIDLKIIRTGKNSQGEILIPITKERVSVSVEI